MIRIRPYKDADEDKILSWCDNEDTFFMWTFGLLGDYPVTKEKFQKTGEYMRFTAVDDDEPVGFFIARNPNGNLNELRFGYGVVDEKRRLQGIGKEMLKQGLIYAFEIYGADRVTLGVYENNFPAISCYTSIGFSKTGICENYLINGENYRVYEMECGSNWNKEESSSTQPKKETDMKKYAFIENVPGLTADKYMDTFDDGEWINHIAGFDGMEPVMDYAKNLIRKGYSLINLCGDFGAEHVEELMKDAPEETEVHFAAYLPSELAKLEALEQYVEYGQIILGNVDEPSYLNLLDPAMNTHAVFVKDQKQAVAAAEELAKAGVDGIELCSGFDLAMTKEIIAAVEAIDKTIPVGSNGIDKDL